MKKTVSVFLILTILMVCIIGNAVADDFSVRNGIQFGMTTDEVKQIEKNNGLDNESIYADEWNYDKTEYHIGYVTSIAGINNGQIIYLFDKDERRLFSFRYYFGDGISEDTAKSILAELYHSLKDKYGNPLHSSDSDGLIFPVISRVMDYPRKYANDIKYYEWLLEYDDYFVLIDAVYYSDRSVLYNTMEYQTNIGYQIITKEEAASAFNELTDKEKRTEEEKERDL